MQSRYDNVLLPTGIEASVSSFHDSLKMKKMRTTRYKHKGKKTLAGSSSSTCPNLQLKKCAMKIRSVNKRFKSRHDKGSFGSLHTRRDQLGDLKVSMEDSRMKQNSLNVTGSSSSMGHLRNDVDIMSKYRNFKKFDIIEDHSDHHYSASGSGTMQASVDLIRVV